MIASARIEGTIATVANVSTAGRKECVRMFDPLCGIDHRLGLGIEMLWQSLNLLHVENAVSLHERDFAFFLAAVALLFGLGDGVGIDNQIAALALLDVCAQLQKGER